MDFQPADSLASLSNLGSGNIPLGMMGQALTTIDRANAGDAASLAHMTNMNPMLEQQQGLQNQEIAARIPGTQARSGQEQLNYQNAQTLNPAYLRSQLGQYNETQQKQLLQSLDTTGQVAQTASQMVGTGPGGIDAAKALFQKAGIADHWLPMFDTLAAQAQQPGPEGEFAQNYLAKQLQDYGQHIQMHRDAIVQAKIAPEIRQNTAFGVADMNNSTRVAVAQGHIQAQQALQDQALKFKDEHDARGLSTLAAQAETLAQRAELQGDVGEATRYRTAASNYIEWAKQVPANTANIANEKNPDLAKLNVPTVNPNRPAAPVIKPTVVAPVAPAPVAAPQQTPQQPQITHENAPEGYRSWSKSGRPIIKRNGNWEYE